MINVTKNENDPIVKTPIACVTNKEVPPPKNKPFSEAITNGILELAENGESRNLYLHWKQI